MSTTEILLLSAIMALNIVMGFKAVQSYGEAKYMKGKLDGFNDCAKIQNEVFNKIKEEHNARSKTKT